MMLRRIFGCKMEEVKEHRENYKMKSLIISSLYQILLGNQIKEDEKS
jgi:hypothetical protein